MYKLQVGIAVDMDSVDTPVWIIMDMDMEDQITRVDMDSGRKHFFTKL